MPFSLVSWMRQWNGFTRFGAFFVPFSWYLQTFFPFFCTLYILCRIHESIVHKRRDTKYTNSSQWQWIMSGYIIPHFFTFFFHSLLFVHSTSNHLILLLWYKYGLEIMQHVNSIRYFFFGFCCVFFHQYFALIISRSAYSNRRKWHC